MENVKSKMEGTRQMVKKAVAAMMALTVCASLGVGYTAAAQPETAYAATANTISGVKISKTSNSATVSWNAVAGATQYDVVLYPASNKITNADKMQKYKHLTGTSATFTGLVNNTKYGVFIYAYDVNGKALKDNGYYQGSVTTSVKKPTNVKMTVEANQGNYVHYGWNDITSGKYVSPSSKVQIAYRASSSAKWKYKTVSIQGFTYKSSTSGVLAYKDGYISIPLSSKAHDPQVKARVINGSKKSGWTKTKHLKVTKKTVKKKGKKTTVYYMKNAGYTLKQ